MNVAKVRVHSVNRVGTSQLWARGTENERMQRGDVFDLADTADWYTDVRGLAFCRVRYGVRSVLWAVQLPVRCFPVIYLALHALYIFHAERQRNNVGSRFLCHHQAYVLSFSFSVVLEKRAAVFFLVISLFIFSSKVPVDAHWDRINPRQTSNFLFPFSFSVVVIFCLLRGAREGGLCADAHLPVDY